MIAEFKEAFAKIIPKDERPIVVFSAIWPFTIAMRKGGGEVVDSVLASLLAQAGAKQSIFMPTFTGGFTNGICNLDTEPSGTGLLTEKFRNLPETRRTASAFFSFAVHGPEAEETVALRAKAAWGTGSLYEWFHNHDAHIITLGTHPTHCSYTHRAEWLAREIIKYRYEKKFTGKIIMEGKTLDIEENLYVRCLQPAVINDWTWLLPVFKDNGMRLYDCKGITISEMSAKKKMDLIVPMIEKDVLALVKNREDFEGC